MKCGHDDCFTCPYPDCIWGEEPKRTPSQIKKNEANKRWRAAHREQRRAYDRMYYQTVRKAKKMCKCFQCGYEWTEARTMLKYHRKYFCDEECLKNYLYEKADDEIEEVFIDSPENRELAKGDYLRGIQ